MSFLFVVCRIIGDAVRDGSASPQANAPHAPPGADFGRQIAARGFAAWQHSAGSRPAQGDRRNPTEHGLENRQSGAQFCLDPVAPGSADSDAPVT
jgi:hypothetical protein